MLDKQNSTPKFQNSTPEFDTSRNYLRFRIYRFTFPLGIRTIGYWGLSILLPQTMTLERCAAIFYSRSLFRDGQLAVCQAWKRHKLPDLGDRLVGSHQDSVQASNRFSRGHVWEQDGPPTLQDGNFQTRLASPTSSHKVKPQLSKI